MSLSARCYLGLFALLVALPGAGSTQESALPALIAPSTRDHNRRETDLHFGFPAMELPGRPSPAACMNDAGPVRTTPNPPGCTPATTMPESPQIGVLLLWISAATLPQRSTATTPDE